MTTKPTKQNLHRIIDTTTEKTITARRTYLEKTLGIKLSAVKHYSFDTETASKKHCENLIGAIHIPLGVVGPVIINFEDTTSEEVYIPLATTEGALVASCNRGCSVLKASGGTNTIILDKKMTRGPVFTATSATTLVKANSWLEKELPHLQKTIQKKERFLRLLSAKSWIVGRNLFIRFAFDTADAMGMNMVTFATQRITDQVCKNFPDIKLIALSGNMCIDKKTSALNFIEGRGYSVQAEARIPKSVLEEKLHTTADQIIEVNYRKNLLGSAMAASLGYNAHFANIIAAIFLATGQDPAQVVEGSMGITTIEKQDDGIYVAAYIPNLNIGTIGGGTGLATQKESLAITGTDNSLPAGKNSARFAQIIATAVLAGEISLLASLSEGSLAKAHKKYGRGE
ncbi:MAG: hydroxymethylglutaryl-CoA reductase [bacterium]